MDNFKSWFEGLLHKGHQHELIGDIEHEIVSKLLELDFSGWWRSVKNVPKEELARFNKMWDVIDNNSPIGLDVGSDTTSFYNDTDRIKDAIDSMGSEIESDYIDFLASQNDNQVKKVMDGHRFRTLKESFTLPITKLGFWVSLKFMLSMANKAKGHNLKELEQDLSSLIKSDELSHSSLKETTDIIQQVKEANRIHVDTFKDDNVGSNMTNEQIKDYLEKIGGIMERNQANVQKGFEKWEKGLFLILNTNLIPSRIRLEIVEIISKSVTRKAIQNSYDKLRMKYPEAINWRFYNATSREVNVVLPEDFDKLQHNYSKYSLLRKLLTRDSLGKMYQALVAKKYISSDTDISDFAFALTGKPKSKENHYRKVNWIGNEKKSLAIFLGLLKDENDTWYWHRSVDLFLYKGTPFTAKQLSSPFGKFVRHPETRKSDWDELEAITKM